MVFCINHEIRDTEESTKSRGSIRKLIQKSRCKIINADQGLWH